VKALTGLGRVDEAMALCREWLREAPDTPGGLWALVELEITREGLESVMARMRKVARIPSRPPVYREIYASLCRRAGQPEKAARIYERMVRETSNAKTQSKRAFALAKSGREAEAIPIMEELLRQDAANVYLHSAYAPACRRAGMLERAETFYVELLERYPEEKGLYGRLRNVRRQREG
jgi:tetratricopeptide (TPR) repeat protein